MEGLIYLFKKTMVNRIKKALRKPVTYIYLVGIVLYFVFAVSGISELITVMHLNNPDSMAVLLSLLIFYLLPANIISYIRRKGLLFRPAEVHFVFPSPANPKKVILYAGMKAFLASLFIGIAVFMIGIWAFHVPVITMLCYFLITVVLENIMEGCLMILCYGNETLPELFFKIIRIILYLLMAVFAIVAGYIIITKGLSFAAVNDYLSQPIIQCIPVIGWNIAMIRLLFIGPDPLNIVCTVLYCISTAVLFVAARKMKCCGEYYEDAMKFADHYEKIRASQKKGDMSILMKKKRFKKAEIEYRGVYAKAIYYRQLLEYKKSRFFIFGFHTLLALGLGIGIAVICYFADVASEMGAEKLFVIPGVMAYVIFIFSSYATKWSKELENPYTFLIPDSNIKKIWYATRIEHSKAIIDGILITIPGGLVLKLNLIQMLLVIAIYVCLSANRLYYTMLSDTIIGDLLGQFGRSILRMVLQAVVMTMGIIGAVMGGIFLGVEAGFFIMIVITIALTVMGAVLASTSFERMETLT